MKIDKYNIAERNESFYAVELLTPNEQHYFFGEPADPEWAIQQAKRTAYDRLSEMKRKYPDAIIIFRRGRKSSGDTDFIADALLTEEENTNISKKYGLRTVLVK